MFLSFEKRLLKHNLELRSTTGGGKSTTCPCSSSSPSSSAIPKDHLHPTFTHFQQPHPTTPSHSHHSSHQLHHLSPFPRSTPCPSSSSSQQYQQHQHDVEFPSSTVGELVSKFSTMDSRRGSFQKRFRSMLFSSRRGKKGLDSSVLEKSLSSPALNQQFTTSQSSGFYNGQSNGNFFESTTWGTLPATLRHRANHENCSNDCQCRPINSGISVPDLSKTLRNYKLALSEKVASKELIDTTTQPKDIAPPLETAIDDQYVVVVSDLDSARKYLSVKSQEMEMIQSDNYNSDQINIRHSTPQPTESDQVDRTNEHGDQQQQEVQSSSASESGRGTCSSEQNKPEQNVVIPDVVYAEVNKKDKIKKAEYLKSKYPQLYSPATRTPMPVVAENESWVSDSTCTMEKSSKNRVVSKKVSSSEKIQRMAPIKGNSYKLPSYKSNRGTRDDCSVSSLDDPNEDNTSIATPKNHKELKNQIRGLQDMYGEILKGMRSSSHNRTNLRSSRKMFGSASTLTSLASRTRRKLGTSSHYRGRSHISSLEDSNRIKTLENHVTTLARSVTYLSSEIRKNERIFEEMEGVRNEMNRMRQQMNFLSESLNSKLTISSAIQLNGGENGEKSKKEKKVSSKLSKLFHESSPPTPLRQFLKHLGYEKYAVLLEAEKIGLDELRYIPEERLHRLGIAMGPRVRILQEIKQLQYSYNSMKRNKSSSFGQQSHPHLI